MLTVLAYLAGLATVLGLLVYVLYRESQTPPSGAEGRSYQRPMSRKGS